MKHEASRTAAPTNLKVGLDWVKPGFLPKARSAGPRQDPKGNALSQGKRRVACGRGIKLMVPLTGLEPVTPALREQGHQAEKVDKINAIGVIAAGVSASTQRGPKVRRAPSWAVSY
jgi:hypothetical protein